MTAGLLGSNADPCPCGAGPGFSACCRPLLLGASPAETAEQLMRSRYTAFARGDVDHLWRTWHPRTRPAEVTVDDRMRWTGLTILDTEAGGAEDDTGTVTFEARFWTGQGPDAIVERSRFARRRGRWVYVDGDRLR